MKKLLPLVLLFFAGASPAQVKDINTSQTGGTWQPWPSGTQFIEMGGALYFMSSDGIHGTELWRTDGTAAGTRIVKDICPGSCSSWIFRLEVWGSALFFSADDGAHGNELWKSDGTEAGTVLVKDLTPGLTGSTPADFFEAGGSLYFSAFQDATGRELWKTDGTEAGTLLAVDLWPGTGTSFPRPMGRIGNTVLLNASDAAHGLELWTFDGSPAGPVLVKDINPGAGDAVYDQGAYLPGYRSFLVVGNRLYFVAQDGTSGYELWASDGTEAGTVLVKDINPGSEGSWPFSLTELNGQLLFRAYDADHGAELWKSDGAEANTVLVKDIRPGTDNSGLSELTALGSWIYFRASDDTHGHELWRSDGTEANTALFKDVRPGPESGFSSFNPAAFAVVGTTLAFFANDGTSGVEPWKSNGTEAGTTLLADLNPGAGSSMLDLYGPVIDLRIVWGGRWYFRAFDGDLDVEVYISDGTPAGTRQLAEINDQTSAFHVEVNGSLFGPRPLADRNGTLFFQASDGISGFELWKSDGTEAGTEQVSDIVSGPNSSLSSQITPLGGSVLFGASSGSGFSDELWISDGTGAGTSLLKDLDPGSSSGGGPQNLTPFGGQVFFTATSSGDNKLWKTNGTEAGTVPVRDLPPTALSPAELTPVGNLLFYSGEGPAGQELWRTDGTEAGTVQVADIAPGPASSSPDGLIRLASRVFFSADDGSSGRELWASDGVSTSRVKDIRPGSGSSILQSWGFAPEAWAATRDRLFFKADDGTTGAELWVHDGTETSPFRLRDVFPGPRSSEIQWLTAAGERVYFVADDGVHGRELWVSDGIGTRMVADLIPGKGSSLPEQLTAVGQNLVFSAHTPDHGREVWLTDGDTVGTRRLTDLAPGPLPSSPISFTLSGPSLYFVATDAEAGFELHSVPRESVDGGMSFYTVAPCRLVDTRMGGGPLSSGYNGYPFAAAGLCGIPGTAKALAVNVTAVDASTSGSLFLFRGGTNSTGASSLPFQRGRDRASNTMVQLGDGSFKVVVIPEFDVSVHLIVDVSGYFE